MFQNIPSNIKFKIFVKETNGKDTSEKVSCNRKYLPVAPLTGDKAKEFYEEVLREPSAVPEGKKILAKPKPTTKSPPKPAQPKAFKRGDLLRMAQNNDVKKLNLFFDQMQDYDVDIVDDFGWTPLMCASCSGAEEAVEILLWNGADPNKMDKSGNTALKLAKKNNQKKIVEILENFNNKPEISDGEEDLGMPPETFSCQTCKANFTMNKSKHESSTLHLFNSKFKTSTFYGIPESNKGFQILLREGWDKEKGLGPDGKGRKFPVKAVMKKDRTGIGAPPQPEKNKREAQNPRKSESKKRRTYERWKDKDFEKNFRLEFS